MEEFLLWIVNNKPEKELVECTLTDYVAERESKKRVNEVTIREESKDKNK